MSHRSPVAAPVSLLLVSALAFPAPGGAQTSQRAGEVQRVIPAASIARGSEHLTAAAKTPVQWEDVVSTEAQGRARLRLDDGSTLNVGSQSSLRVTQHDPAAQRSELELSYGRIRSQVVKLARPGAQFEVRTPAGTAGVVGTDFFLAFENGVMTAIVFEGLLRLCNLAAQCVEVGQGTTSSVRAPTSGAPMPPPDPPQPVSPAAAAEAVGATQVETALAAAPGSGSGWIVPVVAFAALAAAAAILATRNNTRNPAGQTGPIGRVP